MTYEQLALRALKEALNALECVKQPGYKHLMAEIRKAIASLECS